MMKKIIASAIVVSIFASCKKDADPIIVVPPSSGSSIQLNGKKGSEVGTSAGNSVYVDFSKDKQYPIARDSWDLGFFTGSEFKVCINNTAAAYAVATSKTDMNAVGTADTVGVKLAFSQAAPSADDFAKMDNINGLQTLINPSANAAENKVFIINRGTGGAIAARDYMKVRVLRNGNGYTLQYAALTASNFTTIQVPKSGEGEFVYLSFSTGTTITGFPEKNDWDIQWSYGVYKTAFMGADVMYLFSDLIVLNVLQNVQAFARIYETDAIANEAFAKFNKDSVSKYSYSNDRWTIGSSWRSASPSGASVSKSKFYVLKDPSGNMYKIRFISFDEKDGGTRGKPQLQYELIK
ncbi:MAG TPA: HmuY family protein [Niabella sp.]|nr:HmuY family protein [Niabella sp.]HOZ98325.1 HmuY family protein [Niabella sp.]HQW13404.1 HmuY family protein [Niabella sp.]HQX18798.1 HmuY family protein [Niabella sp.]HQX42029.1 HmuY family protein [Niabella sp.]